MTEMHFEELWEKCENLHQEMGSKSSTEELISQLAMKLDLYKTLDTKTEIPEEDRRQAKSRILGEILLTITNLSLKDNINVFESLGVALQYRSVNYFGQKYAG
jgi:hypothetical protein